MQKNTQKITSAFCKSNNLIFHPETEAEAVFIQKKLFDLGLSWKHGAVVLCAKECVTHGLVLLNGCIYYRGDNDTNKYLVCSSSQFDQPFDKNDLENLSGDALVREAFNRLSARLDVLEAKVDKVLAEVSPKELDKPSLKVKREP